MKLHLRSSLLGFVLVAAATVSAQPAVSSSNSPAAPGLDERLARIEKQLARLETRVNDAVTADELAPTLKEYSELTRQLGWNGNTPLTVVKAAGKEQKLSVGGYAQVQGEFGRAPDSRYTGLSNRVQIRRARVTLKGAFQENFEFTLQPDFGNNSIGATSAYRAQFADAYLAWTKYEALNVQLGQFKTPFGYEQLLPDTKTPFIERSLPNDLLTVGRQIGLGLSGAFHHKTFTYAVGAFNGNGVNNGGNDNDQFMYAGRLGAQVWSKDANKFTVAANAYWSNDTGTFIGRRTSVGWDAQLTLGRCDFAAEYLHTISNRLTGADTTADGWYASAGYFVVPKTLQAIVRFESSTASLRAPNTTSTEWVFGLNYYLKGDDIKLVANYLLGDPAGPLSHEGRFLGRLQIAF